MAGAVRSILMLCALLLSPFGAAALDEPDSLGPAWHLSLRGSIQQRRDLEEHYQFTPTAKQMPPSSGGWERRWDEQRAGVRLAHDLLSDRRYLIQPRAGLGLSQAWFSAANNGQGFSETWRTKPGLYWEAGAMAELRAATAAGPFLRLAYDWRASGMTEESETVVSQGPATSGANRDSDFRWQEQEISLQAGWRLGAWTPTAGLARIDWRLQKTLGYHIPESGARNPGELSLIRLLNGEDSRYHYHNGRPWSPMLGLAWSPAPGWSLELSCRLAADPALSLGLEIGF